MQDIAKIVAWAALTKAIVPKAAYNGEEEDKV